MRKFFFLMLLFLFWISFPGYAKPDADAQIDSELNSSLDGLSEPALASPPSSSPKANSSVDKEFEKTAPMDQVGVDPNDKFIKPSGPKKGGSLRVHHPDAAKGLIRINKDGTYQYKVKLGEKSQAASVRFTSISPPKISGAYANVSYNSMYGTSNLTGVLFDYEWQPFTKFGRFGLDFGTGFSTVTGKGTFKTSNSARTETQAEESYTLYVIPLSAFLVYRFEYIRRQWIVPFINGGATYYGLAETRDDGKGPNFAGGPAVGGGGGLHFSISAMDPEKGFTLSREYGIADMWLTLEARVMQGLSSDTDFTNQSINAGITVDY